MLDGYIVLINGKEIHPFQSINSVKAFVKDSIKTNYENQIYDLEHREKLSGDESKKLKTMKRYLKHDLDKWAERMADNLISNGKWTDIACFELFGTTYDMTYQYWEFCWED